MSEQWNESSAASTPSREVEIAKRLIGTAAMWRGSDLPVRAWPKFLRDAERVSKAYLKVVR